MLFPGSVESDSCLFLCLMENEALIDVPGLIIWTIKQGRFLTFSDKKYTVFVGRRTNFLSLGVAHRDPSGTNIINLVLRQD
jgi:hypothetical protein